MQIDHYHHFKFMTMVDVFVTSVVLVLAISGKLRSVNEFFDHLLPQLSSSSCTLHLIYKLVCAFYFVVLLNSLFYAFAFIFFFFELIVLWCFGFGRAKENKKKKNECDRVIC